jgi:hypothetical protein
MGVRVLWFESLAEPISDQRDHFAARILLRSERYLPRGLSLPQRGLPFPSAGPGASTPAPYGAFLNSLSNMALIAALHARFGL